MCVYVFCYEQNSKTNYIRNIKFDILLVYDTQMFLKLFIKIRQKHCAQEHTKKLSYIKVHGGSLLLLNFRLFRLEYDNKYTKNGIFAMLKNMWTTKFCLNGIYYLSTGPHEEIRIYEFMEIAEVFFFSYYFMQFLNSNLKEHYSLFKNL